MSYLVHLSFDIKDESPETYAAIEVELNVYGLYTSITSRKGDVIDLPNNTFVGKFKGESTAKVRDDITVKIRDFFVSLGVKGDIFVSVGGDWAWGSRGSN